MPPAMEWCRRDSRTVNSSMFTTHKAAQNEKLKGKPRPAAPPRPASPVGVCATNCACAGVEHAHSVHSLSSPRPGRQRPFLVTSPKRCVISARRGQAGVFPPGAAGAGRARWGEARARGGWARAELLRVRSWPGPAHHVGRRRQPRGEPQRPGVPCSGLSCRRAADHQSHGEDSERERGVLRCRNQQHPAGEGRPGAREARPAAISAAISAAVCGLRPRGRGPRR